MLIHYKFHKINWKNQDTKELIWEVCWAAAEVNLHRSKYRVKPEDVHDLVNNVTIATHRSVLRNYRKWDTRYSFWCFVLGQAWGVTPNEIEKWRRHNADTVSLEAYLAGVRDAADDFVPKTMPRYLSHAEEHNHVRRHGKNHGQPHKARRDAYEDYLCYCEECSIAPMTFEEWCK